MRTLLPSELNQVHGGLLLAQPVSDGVGPPRYQPIDPSIDPWQTYGGGTGTTTDQLNFLFAQMGSGSFGETFPGLPNDNHQQYGIIVHPPTSSDPHSSVSVYVHDGHYLGTATYHPDSGQVTATFDDTLDDGVTVGFSMTNQGPGHGPNGGGYTGMLTITIP